MERAHDPIPPSLQRVDDGVRDWLLAPAPVTLGAHAIGLEPPVQGVDSKHGCISFVLEFRRCRFAACC